MKRLGNIVKNRLFFSILGIICLSLFIWFVAPFIGYNQTFPLESKYNRVMAIAGMSIMAFILALTRFYKARKRNAQMLDSLADEDASANASASVEELQALKSKMEDAIGTLKSRNFSRAGGSRFLYELPWYIIMGPPGAGKTTLLSNSGLNFPLEEAHGRYSIKGLGGTRNCDWWFTDQAVLLDTAGRYTTQDSEAKVDKSAWNGFLAMLREKRSRRPINGVLLALSIEDILTGDEEELEHIAKTLRARIEELYEKLAIAPPVYLIFTKCDMLSGFSEYFNNLDRSSREQVWGYTLDINNPEQENSLESGVQALAERLKTQTIGKLHGELSQKNREKIYGFPLQFSYARARVDVLIQSLTAPSRLLHPVMFRGAYFTSATQTGSVFEQVIKNVSQSFGITETPVSHSSAKGRSFFIKQLLGDVVFGEAGLAGTNLVTEKRYKRWQWAATLGIVGLAIGLLALWSTSFVQNHRLIDQVDADALKLQQTVDALDQSSLDLLASNDVLNQASSLASINSSKHNYDGLVVKHAGLYQGNKIGQLAQSKYDDLLQDVLLPRLVIRLEHQMHARNTDNEFLFEALKTYQMIGQRDRFESEIVTGWFVFDFDNNLSAEFSEQARSELKAHVSRLFEQPPRRLTRALDDSIVKQYQKMAAATTLQQRAYQRIRASALREINSFTRLSNVVDLELSRVFARQDGVSLDKSLHKFFTPAGYRETFLPASKVIGETLFDDRWVLGSFSNTAGKEIDPKQLKTLITEQYYNDYIEQWDNLFNNLILRSVNGLEQVTALVSLITDTDSPLKKLLVVASEQTTLTLPAFEDPTEETDDGAAQAAVLGGILGTPEELERKASTMDLVTEHFQSLHQIVDGFESNSSTVDATLTQLAELNIQLLPLAQAPAGEVDPQLIQELSTTIQKLELKANRLPDPLGALVEGFTNDVKDVVSGGFCQQIDAAWKVDVLPFYQKAIRNRYPLNRLGTADISLKDFGAFFGPGGLIDTFVNTNLQGKITGQWTWAGSDGSPVCLSQNSLRQLRWADEIKNTFFSKGGNLPAFGFSLEKDPIVNPGIDDLFLSIGGVNAQYSHGRIQGETTYNWPSRANNFQTSLRVVPAVAGTASNLSFTGPWSVLRLLQSGVASANGNNLAVEYSFAGREVKLSFNANEYNPLNSSALSRFRAPGSL